MPSDRAATRRVGGGTRAIREPARRRRAAEVAARRSRPSAGPDAAIRAVPRAGRVADSHRPRPPGPRGAAADRVRGDDPPVPAARPARRPRRRRGADRRRRLPPGADRPTIRDAIDGYATELVLGSFLDELLTEPFREPGPRAPDPGLGGGRGPTAVRAERCRRRGVPAAHRRPGSRPGWQRLAATGVGTACARTPGQPASRPRTTTALRVSSALAGARCRRPRSRSERTDRPRPGRVARPLAWPTCSSCVTRSRPRPSPTRRRRGVRGCCRPTAPPRPGAPAG